MIPLVVENLTKHFGGLTALQGVSLAVEAGERRAIVGPNGAGKTTLFNLISGVLSPSSGRIFIFGRDITNLPAYRRAALGLARTFQVNNLFPSLSLRDNVLLAVQGLDSVKYNMIRPSRMCNHLWSRVQDLLDQWGFTGKGDVPVSQLSYGEQRQVEILLALAGSPGVLLLDEPTAGLAPGEIAMVTSLVQRLPREIAVLLVEHDMDVLFQLATQMTVLCYGQVLVEGTPEEVRRNARVQELYLGAE